MVQDQIELTLLSEDEIWGDRQLDVLKKYGNIAAINIAAITDLAILTGCYYEDDWTYTAPDDNSLKGRTGWFYTRSSAGDGDVRVVNRDGDRGWTYAGKRSGGVRPVLLSSSVFSQISPNRVRGHNGTEEVEYGEYPQYAPDSDMQRRLESEYQRGNLQTTGRDYTFDNTRYNDYSQGFQPVKYDEYEYNGKKYIRVKANSCHDTANFKLSNGEYYHNGDYVWVEVSPVKWLIDDKTQTLLSKVGLLAGIRFHTDEKKYNGDFSTTEMKEYLDKYMLHDLFQGYSFNKQKKNNDNLNEKSKKINDIVDQIYRLLDNYYGDEDIEKKVTDLVNRYNEDLKNAFNKHSELVLTTSSMDKGFLYQKLIKDLEDILTKLKVSSEKYKEYSLMLDLVKNCLGILRDNEDNKMMDDIADDIMTIKHVVLPFLNDDNINNEIIKIFLEEEADIIAYIKGDDNSSIKNCKTYEDFKLKIRKKLHPFLINLNNNVRNKDLINEIRSGYLKICQGIFRKEKEDYISNFLNEIQKLVLEINANGNDVDKQKLNEIIKNKLEFYDNDLIGSITKIKKLYISIYGIVIDIKDRENVKQELDDYTVTINSNKKR